MQATATPTATATAVARLLEYARGKFVALPPHTTLEVIEHPKIVPVPGAAYYGLGLMAWQGKHLAVMDLDTLLRAYPAQHARTAPRYALVVAYQQAPGAAVEQGAIALMDLPESVSIDDDSACELPADSDLWKRISLACFRIEAKVVPVVDTARLFGAFHG